MSVRCIIVELGGAAALARDLDMPGGDVGAKAIRAWALRDSIPAEWFAGVERAARSRGREDITVATLAEMAERRRLQRS